MSVIGMGSGPHRKSPVTNQQIMIDKLKKLKSDYKKEMNKYKEGQRIASNSKLLSDYFINEVFELIDKL